MPRTKRSPTIPMRGYTYPLGKLQTLEEAAQTLRTDRLRLQRECEQKAERCSDTSVAYLEGGIVAIQCSEGWKFRFPLSGATLSGRGE